MATIIILILITIFLIYLLFDFLLAANANDFLKKWLKRFLWAWLPFYGLYYLTKKLLLKMEGKN